MTGGQSDEFRPLSYLILMAGPQMRTARSTAGPAGGDPLLVSWLAANHDPAQFDRPDEVVLDRADNRHLAFGLGPHRCIGSHLARAMFQVMLREVLTRIPDYQVDFDRVVQYLGNPAMTGLLTLPATFTPGPVVGVERPF